MALLRYDGFVKSALGQAIAGAQIYACTQPANTAFIPPSPLLSIFSDINGNSLITQPLRADGFGHFDFYIPSTTFTLVIVNGGKVQQVYADQAPMGSFGSGGGSIDLGDLASTDPASALSPYVANDANPNIALNQIVMINRGSIPVDTKRKVLNVYLEVNGQQSGANYDGFQSNVGVTIDANTSPSAGAAEAGEFSTSVFGPGPFSQINALKTRTSILNGANLTNVIGYSQYLPQFDSGTTTSNYFGIFQDNPSGGGNVTNWVGASLQAPISGVNVTNGYGILCSGGTAALVANDATPSHGFIGHGSTPGGSPGTLHDGWYGITGSPEGVLTANIGSIASRQDGGPGTALYVKETGSGNVGWTAVTSTSNATNLQGTPISTVGPTSLQVLQFVGGKWTPETVAGISTYNVAHSTDYIWSIVAGVGFGALTAGTPATVTFATAPQGIDCSGRACTPYWIYISGVGTAEAVKVTGGTCTSGALNCTVQFTPFFSHSTGYTLGTATAGIQEALNIACGVDPNPILNGYCKVIVPPSAIGFSYPVHATITMCTTESSLEGYGATLACDSRGPCLQIGDLVLSTHANSNTVQGLTFRPTPLLSTSDYVGNLITSTSRASGVSTINTNASHNFRVGDPVTILFTDDTRYWGDVPQIASVPSSTSFTYNSTGRGDATLQTTPGLVALTYVCVLDNANGTALRDLKVDYEASAGAFNGIFDLWDDEDCTIDNFTNNGIALNRNINWSPSFIASYGANNLPSATQQLAAVLSLSNTSITAQSANAITFFNCNGLYIDNTVLQATGPWQVNCSNQTGNFQGASIRNLYSESGAGLNPVSPARSPWPGLGTAGLIAGPSTGAASFNIRGNGNVAGAYPIVGTGSTNYIYYVVAHDTTAGTSTPPLPVMYAKSNGGAVTVSWPRIANGTDAFTYDVLRVASASGTIADPLSISPYTGGCPGGSTSAMGSVVVGQAQQSGFIQTFSDDTTVATTSYPTVPTGNYLGNITFWPGQSITTNAIVHSDFPLFVMQTGMLGNPTNDCMYAANGGAQSPSTTTAVSTFWDAGNGLVNHQALVLNDGPNNGSWGSNKRGRLNFGTSGGSSLNPGHIITLVDSNPLKTRAYSLNRPPNSSNDTFIGLDSGNVGLASAQLTLGAPIAISQYISNIGDGASWLERLTATKKQFAVPVQLASYTFATLPSLPDGSSAYCSNCTRGGACGSGGTGALAVHINGGWACL
jgi:hypothetical protein